MKNLHIGRALATATAALVGSALTVGAQGPPGFVKPDPASQLDARVRAAVEIAARPYKLIGVRLFGRDSARLYFADSTLTRVAVRTNAWMFGPPVTPAEAEGCPPEKVLGRKIARAMWRSLNRPAALQQIVVEVRGTRGLDQWTSQGMYYYQKQLEGPWVGEPRAR